MSGPLVTDGEFLGAAKAVGGALLAGGVAYLGFQLQQGGRQSRLRRKLLAQLELLKALEGVTAQRSAQTRALARIELKRLLVLYTPTRNEVYDRQKRFGIAVVVVSMGAGVLSAIFLSSQEWLVGGCIGIALAAANGLSETARNRVAAEERRNKERQVSRPWSKPT